MPLSHVYRRSRGLQNKSYSFVVACQFFFKPMSIHHFLSLNPKLCHQKKRVNEETERLPNLGKFFWEVKSQKGTNYFQQKATRRNSLSFVADLSKASETLL